MIGVTNLQVFNCVFKITDNNKKLYVFSPGFCDDIITFNKREYLSATIAERDDGEENLNKNENVNRGNVGFDHLLHNKYKHFVHPILMKTFQGI